MSSSCNTHLISPSDIDRLARPCYADEDIAYRFIEEAQLQDIRPSIGSSLYAALLDAPENYDTLLDGGEYEGACGSRSFVGLRTALAYYAWARLVKVSPSHLTRFGYVVKEDEHSRPAEWKERLMTYEDAFAIADGYMRECLDYLKAEADDYPEWQGCCGGGDVKSKRVEYIVVGE